MNCAILAIKFYDHTRYSELLVLLQTPLIMGIAMLILPVQSLWLQQFIAFEVDSFQGVRRISLRV
jgi:hypothetical protein